jgi:hypothetical protein
MNATLPSLLLACTLPLFAADESADTAPHGRYVEARTASVFAGPCHYNSELTTAGREALVAWSFEGGELDGVALAGARAVAAVVGDRNLSLEGARRESVLYLDAAATEAQRAALRELLEERYAPVLGRVLAVRVAPVELGFEGDAFDLEIADCLALTGTAMPDRACCSMPSNVWYRPLVEADAATRTEDVLVGYTERCTYDDQRPLAATEPPVTWTLRDTAPRWTRCAENSAFLASFRLLERATSPLAAR